MGNLGVFVNDPGNINDWLVLSDNECQEGQCAIAEGNGDIVNMSVNFNTLDRNETNLSFFYSLDTLLGADYFSDR